MQFALKEANAKLKCTTGWTLTKILSVDTQERFYSAVALQPDRHQAV
jgi:hypothetical protein